MNAITDGFLPLFFISATYTTNNAVLDPIFGGPSRAARSKALCRLPRLAGGWWLPALLCHIHPNKNTHHVI
jgi:hypothetical protein